MSVEEQLANAAEIAEIKKKEYKSRLNLGRMTVTCAGRSSDAELVALLRRLVYMAGDSAAFDTNKLYDGLCRVECAEERIVITRQLREIRTSADEAGVACANGAVMVSVRTFVNNTTTPLLAQAFDAAAVAQRLLGLLRTPRS